MTVAMTSNKSPGFALMSHNAQRITRQHSTQWRRWTPAWTSLILPQTFREPFGRELILHGLMLRFMAAVSSVIRLCQDLELSGAFRKSGSGQDYIRLISALPDLRGCQSQRPHRYILLWITSGICGWQGEGEWQVGLSNIGQPEQTAWRDGTTTWTWRQRPMAMCHFISWCHCYTTRPVQ